MDEWGVDVVIGGSQKGLMLPPGMSFTAINDRAWQAAQAARNPRRYWDWRPLVENGRQASFCGTPPIAHFYGLEVSLDMLEEEGLENVFARHHRLAKATRACVRAWGQGGGPEIYSLDPAAASDSLTAVLMPQGHDADRVRAIANDQYSVALGRGLGTLQGRILRIGHMGDINESMLLGALASIELALAQAGVPHARGGVSAAMDSLRAPARSGVAVAAE
jgi:alanine-glyoxylate transaminase/serine-glyoxylate transaminase/serine-pyruvate transaminase